MLLPYLRPVGCSHGQTEGHPVAGVHAERGPLKVETQTGRCVPRPACVLAVLSVRVSSSLKYSFRCRVVAEFRNHDLVLDLRHAGS